MKGWILYKRKKDELTDADHGVNRLLIEANSLDIALEVYRPEQFELVVTSTGNNRVLIDDHQVAFPHFILPRLGAETSYFALAIIRQLENSGVFTCNSSTAIETVRDKMFLSQLLARSGLSIPKTMLVKFPLSVSVVEREIGFPIVIKNISGSRGIGIHLCETVTSFMDLMDLIASHGGNSQMILQEFVKSSYGRDLRVFVLGGKVIGCMQRISNGSFKANYSLGGRVECFYLTPAIEALAIRCAALFNLDIAGVDLLFGDSGFKICEANSSPGFKGIELVTGENIARQILKFVIKQLGSRA